jgi:hypothetical protein
MMSRNNADGDSLAANGNHHHNHRLGPKLPETRFKDVAAARIGG